MDELDTAMYNWIEYHTEKEKISTYLIRGYNEYTLNDIKQAVLTHQPLWLELKKGLLKLTIELLVNEKIFL